MAKVVYNRDFGGFSLSTKAIQWMEENGSEETKKMIKEIRSEAEKICGDGSNDYLTVEAIMSFKIADVIERHNKDLVTAVETLGKKANGSCADLSVYELKGKDYRISEYDGAETVVEKEDEEYIHIED